MKINIINFLKLAIVSCLFTFQIYGQQSIIGIVSDQDGNPLMGVTVIEIKTNNGTVTDFDGNYAITLSNHLLFLVLHI